MKALLNLGRTVNRMDSARVHRLVDPKFGSRWSPGRRDRLRLAAWLSLGLGLSPVLGTATALPASAIQAQAQAQVQAQAERPQAGQGAVDAPFTGPAVRDSVAREWAIREAAAAGEGPAAGDGPESWTSRADRLEALRRRWAVNAAPIEPAQLTALRLGWADEHPVVRTRALEALAVLRWRAREGFASAPLDLQLSPRMLSEALWSPAPESRRALAEVLGEPLPGEGSGARPETGPGVAGSARELVALGQLLIDEDPLVREQAFASLGARAAREPRASDMVAAELVRRAQESSVRVLFDGLFSLALQSPPASTWENLATWLAEAESRQAVLPPNSEEALALWLTWRGVRAVAEAGRFAAGGRGDVRVLLEGWFPARSLDERADELLARIQRSSDEDLGAALLAGAHELTELEPAARAAAKSGMPGVSAGLDSAANFSDRLFAGLTPYVSQRGERWSGSLGLEWVEAAAAVLGQRRVALDGPDYLRSPESRQLLFAALSREPSWPRGAVMRLLGLSLPGGERSELASALEFAALRGDPVATDALLLLAEDEDPELSRAAFRAVAIAPGAERVLDRLHSIWRELPLDERIDRLGVLTAELSPGPFTEDLLELGEHHDDLRTRLARLLSRGPYTERVHIELARWLVTELAAKAEGRSEDAGRTAASLLVELDRFAGERAQGDLVQAVRLLPTDEAVGLAAASRLGASESGRERLAQLARVDLIKRTELEIALQLSGPQVPQPEREARRHLWLGVLLRGAERGDLGLLGRVFEALARSGDERGAGLLERVALDSLETEIRAQMALTALQSSQLPSSVEALERAARRSGFHERRVGAARSLASSAAPEASAALVALTDDIRRAHDAGLSGAAPAAATALAEELGLDLLVPGTLEELDHLLEELELGCARRGLLDRRLTRGLLFGPLALAESDLVQRHADQAGSDPAFRYRRERNLAVALARAGRLAEGLGSLDALGARLDPAYLLELARGLEIEAAGRSPESVDPRTLTQLGRWAALGLARLDGREARELDQALRVLQRAASAEEAAFVVAARARLARSGRLGRSGLDPSLELVPLGQAVRNSGPSSANRSEPPAFPPR